MNAAHEPCARCKDQTRLKQSCHAIGTRQIICNEPLDKTAQQLLPRRLEYASETLPLLVVAASFARHPFEHLVQPRHERGGRGRIGPRRFAVDAHIDRRRLGPNGPQQRAVIHPVMVIGTSASIEAQHGDPDASA